MRQSQVLFIALRVLLNLFTFVSLCCLHLLTVLFHFANYYFTQAVLFQYNAQLAPYIFHWAGYVVYY